MNLVRLARETFRFRARSLIFFVIVVFIVLIGGALLITSSAPYSEAKFFAREDTQIISRLGPVLNISPRPFDGFELNDSPDGGTADFAFALTGRDHQAKLTVHLTSKAGRWIVEHASLETDDDPIVRVVR